MRKIEAVIRPERLEAVRMKLEATGYPGVMVSEMAGHGRQRGVHPDWPQGLRENFLPKVKLEIVVPVRMQEQVVQAILSAARTGEVGDGKIFITEIKDAIRVRTGERGDSALSMPQKPKAKKAASR